MSLCVLRKMICLNTFFYSDMCLMKEKKLKNYQWFIRTIKELYEHHDISLFDVWLSNDESNISLTIRIEISSNAIHILCVWHMNNNVHNNCKKHFAIAKKWIIFYDDKKKNTKEDWHKIFDAKIENELNLQWQLLQNKYNLIESIICEYLNNEIMSKKRKWSRVWIDAYMHFNNISNSRCEEAHHDLKFQLESFIDNVCMMIQKSDSLCDTQRINYRILFDEIKQRLSSEFKKSLYRDLRTYVTSFVLREIDKHYKKLLDAQNNNRSLSACTKSFNNTMSLFCAHIIEKRLADAISEEVLKLSDVHSHWRFKKSIRHYREFDEFLDVDEIIDEKTSDSNSLLQIQNFRMMRAKRWS